MKTILFWDEEHAIRTVCSEVLRNEGFTVLEAADLEQAIKACEEYGGPIDLSIVKATYGISAIKRLAEAYPQMSILFIGEPEWKARDRSLFELSPRWLQYPFTSDALVQAVHRLAGDEVSHAGN